MHLTHKFLNKYLFKCPLLALLNAPLIFSFSHHTYVNCLQIYKYIFFFHYFVLTGYTQILLKKKKRKLYTDSPKTTSFFSISVMFKTASFSFSSKNVNPNSSLVEPLIFSISPFTATFNLPLLFTSTLQMLLMQHLELKSFY
jgi:hypothetical protein